MRRVPSSIPAAALALIAFGCATGDEAPPEPAPRSGLELAPPTVVVEPVVVPPLPPGTLVQSPDLLTGALSNGLRYAVLRHPVPEGRLIVWLHVDTGSLNETDAQRGVAHFLEHMAFNGSEHFPPGSVVPYFQSLGLAFGRDQNAFTSFDQTTYQLALPDVREETIGKAMLFLSDVASRLTLCAAEIDAERQIILEEKRARSGAQSRVREIVNSRLAPESTYGRRAPIGTEETIRAVSLEDFRAYYSKWYVPDAMTVIAVGDAEPASIVAQIRERFEDAPAKPVPEPLDAGVRATKGRRAIVAADPELATCDVSIARVAPPRAPSTTESDLRREIVETIGARAFGRRAQRLTAAGKASYLEGDCAIRDTAGALTTYRVHCRAVPKDWRRNLGDLGVTLQRARLHGFSAREIESVRTAMLSDASEAADREPTLPARDLITRINGAIAQGEPFLSAAQRSELLERLLPSVTAEEVSAAFAANFDPADVVFVLEIGSAASPPSEEEFLAIASAAVDVKPEAEIEGERAEAVLPEPPPVPGKFVAKEFHEASGVHSAWLENGVRVHHRSMQERREEATVSITLAAGPIEETAEDRGIHEAAIVAWSRPAGGGLTNEQVRDMTVGWKVRTRADLGEDTMTLVVTGDPDELGRGLQLARLLLTEPVVESRALGGWQQRTRQAIDARRVQPQGLLGETVDDAFYAKTEVRRRPLDADHVRRIRSAAAQTLLRETTKSAPIEVAVVGDIALDTAMALVAQHLGTLPARPRIGPKTLTERRDIARPAGPIQVAREFDLKTEEALVLDGFFAADATDVRDARLLDVAARILTTRMTKNIREEKQLVYSIRATSRPAVAFPGLGMFATQAPTDPAKGPLLAAALGQIYAAFAKDGPTEDELAVAKKLIVNQLDEESKTPSWWLGVLGTLDYRGRDLDSVVGAAAAYRSFTASDVREAFAKYLRPESRFHFVISPKAAAPR